MRVWNRVSLLPDATLAFPRLEEPRQELARAAETPGESRPEIPDFAGADEQEDVVGLGLAHELPDQIGANLRVGIRETLAELAERQIAVPEKVGTILRIGQPFPGREAQHAASVADPGRAGGNRARAKRGIIRRHA